MGGAGEIILDTRSGMSHNETNNNERWEQMNIDNFAITLRLSSLAWSDHYSRLYDGNWHIDDDQCVVYRQTELGNQVEVEMTTAAAREFLADMEYQIEFGSGSYRAQCRRAYKTVRASLDRAVAS